MKNLPVKAWILIVAVAAAGVAVFGKAMLQWGEVHEYLRFAAYLTVAVITARCRVTLPKMTSSMAVNLPFILIAVLTLSLPEALTIAAVSTFVQSFWPEGRKPNPVQVLFNVSVLVVAVQLTWLTRQVNFHNAALAVCACGVTVLLANTLPVAAIIAATESKNVGRTWLSIVQLTFPYYLVAVGLASLVLLANHAVGWQMPLFILPATFLMYRSFRTYFRQMSEAVPG
ncbi:MAG TPA: hypothetical protein VEF05_00630, partial [Terriglobales bacterium]|nr:hypothetical protein [Terriglobales bacterium]